jgi:hypothetical protein
MTIQRYNVPDKDDPQWGHKVVDLIRNLFEHADNPIKSHTPLDKTPDEGLQHGDLWYDNVEHKFKVNTANGVKTLKYE